MFPFVALQYGGDQMNILCQNALESRRSFTKSQKFWFRVSSACSLQQRAHEEALVCL